MSINVKLSDIANRTVVDDTANTRNDLAASANSVNSVFNIVTAAFLQANAAFDVANTAVGSTAAGAQITANAAFDKANGGFLQANAAYTQANAAFLQANIAFSNATAAFSLANVAVANAYAAFNTGNGAFDQANAATTISTGAFNQANVSFNNSNSAFTQANLAYNNAIAAFAQANLSYTNAIAGFAQANIATSNASAAYGKVNSAFIQANAAYGQANGSFLQANIAYSNAIAAFSQANIATTNAYSAFNTGNAAFIQANAAFNTGNAAFTQANLAYSNAVAGFTQANIATSNASAAYGKVNSAFIQANASFGQANGSFIQANSGYVQANAAFLQANLAYNNAISAFATANAAYTAANAAGGGFSQAAFNQANTAYAAATQGTRNRLINGAMTFDQRNVGLYSTTSANYVIDRWLYSCGVSGKISAQQNAGVTGTLPAGFNSYFGFVSQSAYASTASDFFNCMQSIEGTNIIDLAWGTSFAANVTLSFWVNSSLTGTFGGALRNGSFTRSYPFTYTITAANTWQYKTITIPGDTAGQWFSNNSIGISAIFDLGTGTTYSGPAGTWAGANYVNATGVTKLVATSGASWGITGVQIEKGNNASPFEFRHYTTELALCQRYYTKTFPVGTPVVNGPSTGFTGALSVQFPPNNIGYYATQWRFPVTMRIAPSITFYSPSVTTGNGYWVNSAENLSTPAIAVTTSENMTYCYLNAGSAFQSVADIYYAHAIANSEL